MLGAGAAVAAAGVGITIAETSSSPKRTGTTTTTTTPSAVTAPTPSDWRRLAGALTGTLILPSDPSYGRDRLLYNERFDDLRPRAIAYCASESDVQRSVAFCREHGLALAARSGGHSYGGYSSSEGFVIDVSRLGGIGFAGAPSPAPETAGAFNVGAGAQLIDVYNALGRLGLVLPAGSCPTVGIAGLTLGGGQGVLGRKFGLTADHLARARVVLADGRLITADAHSHPDLWWALRGGGGGNFGIATAFSFAVDPAPPLSLFTLQFPWASGASVLEAWLHWVAGAPDELWTNCLLERAGASGYLCQVAGVYCGPATELSTLVDRFTASTGAAVTYRFVGGEPYLNAMKVEAGCESLSIAACHVSTERPGGVLSRSAYAAKSSYVNGPLGAAQCQRLIDAVTALGDYAPYVGGALAFDAYGGAINRVPADATAFVHRDQLACIQASYSWSTSTAISEISGGQRWLEWLGAHVFDPSTGAYQNYIDPTLADWATAYYGTNLPRLRRVKAAYDPDDVFHFAQSIPLP